MRQEAVIRLTPVGRLKPSLLRQPANLSGTGSRWAMAALC